MGEYIKVLPTTESWSIEIYYILLAGEILPNMVERLLYMDVDIIVNGSISELYYMDMKGMELAAAEDAVVQDNFSKAQSCLFAEYPEIRYYNVISQTVNLNDGEKQKQTDMLRMIHTGQ